MRNLLGRLRRSGSRSLVEQLATLTSVGDGSTLSLDFTTGVLDPRLTFTRSSTATYIGADGLVKTMAAAPTNDPTKARFDHDPTTRAPRGLLIEGQAVNIMFRSQAINTSPWFNAGTMTVSETGAGSPANDATSNVVTWTNGTGAGGAWLQQNVAVSAGSLVVGNAYTWSVWIKSRGGRRVNVFAVLQGASGNREMRVDFGVSPPTVTSTVATGWTSIQTPTIVEYPNGWYKVTTGGTLPSGATSVNFGFSNSDAVPASGTNGFEAWGYQLEAGSGASSYIPTGASTGTRNQDQMQMTDLASLGFNTSAGTMTINGTYVKDANSAAFPRSIRFMSASVQSMAMITSGKTLFGNTPNTSGGSYFEASRTLASAGAFKFGWTLTTAANPALASATVSLNGSSTSITPLGQGDIVNPISLDFLYPSGSALNFPSMNISSLKYWPYATTAAELNVRTSL
jgi:hypothetical protein